MGIPWFRNLFYRPRKQQLERIQTLADEVAAGAQYSPGLKSAGGKGTARKRAQSAYSYLKAADQNHASAQLKLGIMLTSVHGVARDNAEAVMCVQMAAQRGDAGAQHDLGLRHRRASFKGLPKDALESNLEAYKWFRLAAAQGFKGSDTASKGIALGMTREQVTEGNHRAAAFLAAGSNPIPA